MNQEVNVSFTREDDDDPNRVHSVSAKGMDNEEWVRTQQKTFVRWINHHLKAREMEIENLIPGLCNGVALLNLLEVLTDKKVGRFFKKPFSRIQHLNNLDVALKFLAKEEIQLVNIGATDVVDENVNVIMGLIWHLIAKYEATMTRSEILHWVNNLVGEEYGIKCSNFSTSFNDGRVACALVDSMDPGCIDLSSLSDDGLSNNQLALEQGQRLGVPIVLDAEDLANPNIDELSVMTFVSGLYSRHPNPHAAIQRCPGFDTGLYVEVSGPTSTIVADQEKRTLSYEPAAHDALPYQVTIMWKGKAILPPIFVANKGVTS